MKVVAFWTGAILGLGVLWWLLDIGIYYVFAPRTEHYQGYPERMWVSLLVATVSSALGGFVWGLFMYLPGRGRERNKPNGS